MFANNNITLYGIQNQTEKYFWICYLITILMSALFGDTIILIASAKYNAFKLNKFIIVVLQHMAVCDLILSVSYVLPPIISMIADKWILGEFLAYIVKGFIYLTYPMSTLLICVLATSKLLILQYPLKFKTCPNRRAHLICTLCWLLSALSPLVVFIKSYYENHDFIFNYQTYDIYYKKGKVTGLVLGSLYCLATIIIILATISTLRFLHKAKRLSQKVRRGGTIRWQGIFTVVLTATIFSISTIPWIVYEMIEPYVEENLTEHVQSQLKRITTYITMINVMANFYIYTFSVPSFRNFLYSTIWSIFSNFSSSISCKQNLVAIHAENDHVCKKTEQHSV